MKFFEQKNTIVDILTSFFPVSVVRHPTYECDDTIYNLISRSSTVTPWVVVSNDSDFTQLLNEFPYVKIWNPIKKMYVETPEYDYVTWKSLRGDATDNIPGIPGCGDKTALKLVDDPVALKEYLERPGHREQFARNYGLIKFDRWSDEDALAMTSSVPSRDWDQVHQRFSEMGFASLTADKSWSKFTKTFDSLWG
jgi:5'-3' exonuclease